MTATSETTPSSSTEEPPDLHLLDNLSSSEQASLTSQLDTFVVFHMSAHRPVALVSSGGTAVDLEVRAVRSLENFSTGLRGALAVETLLRKGYAVIHLHRTGSAAPFARVLSQLLGRKPHAAWDMKALSQLVTDRSASEGEDELDDDEDDAFMIPKEDPWLTNNTTTTTQGSFMEHGAEFNNQHRDSSSTDGLQLKRHLQHSSVLQKIVREQRAVRKEHRLLTICFRTVDDYLAKLQLCAQAIHPCRALALVYLAAAVSDFTIPLQERPQHKIQSSSSTTSSSSSSASHQQEQGLVLHLKPTPKTIGILRSHWCPKAFCVSCKLETDAAILRAKAEKAVQNYGVHMVIGNLLDTRHQTVWVLHPEDQRDLRPTSATDWAMDPLTRTSNTTNGITSISDELEDLLLDKVVESHFEFIAWHFSKEGAESARQAQRALQKKRREARRNVFWAKWGYYGTELAGWALSFALSYAATMALQRVSNSAHSWRGGSSKD